MKSLSGIDITRSIQLKRLVQRSNWEFYFNAAAIIITCFFLISYTILAEIKLSADGLFSRFLLYFISPAIAIIALYTIYRKIRERKLEEVKTCFSKIRNKSLLKDFLEKYTYHIHQQNQDIVIVVDEHMLSWNGLWRKKYVFLIDDDMIYFNIVKLYPSISPPVLFDHLILKHDLKKFIADASI